MNSTKFYTFTFYRVREYILTGNLFIYLYGDLYILIVNTLYV